MYFINFFALASVLFATSLFHGTSRRNAEAIVQNSTQGSLDGVDLSIANQATRDAFTGYQGKLLGNCFYLTSHYEKAGVCAQAKYGGEDIVIFEVTIS